MNMNIDDTGIIQAILECFQKQRLPRVMEIKQKLDRGETLNEFDIEYLSEAIHDNCGFIPYLGRHPEYESLVSRVIHYYKAITDEALSNEK
jgi:hypothetical protein